MKRTGELHISAPRIEIDSDKARLVADISSSLGEGGGGCWIEVDGKYRQYLCDERSDGFVVGMLRYAMAHGLDIRCDAPIGEELLYNLRTYLIPSLSDYSSDLYATNIFTDIDSSELPNFGAVGTGVSLGIDSIHSILHHLDSGYSGHNLSHIVINNVGAYDPMRGAGQFKWKCEQARAFAKESGLELIEIDSNVASLFDKWNCRYFRLTHTYVNAFPVLLLQKFWKTYYYGSSGYDFSEFTLSQIDKGDCSLYDLLSLNVFSTRRLRFYSEGAAKTRFEKTRDVATYPPARKYLHVCTHDDGPCCNTCEKCCRTIMTLDALGKLDDFRSIFDVDYYRRNRKWYLNWMYYNWYFFGKESLLEEVYSHFKGEVTLGMKIKMSLIAFRKKIYPYVPQWLRGFRGLLRGKERPNARRELFGALPKR